MATHSYVARLSHIAQTSTMLHRLDHTFHMEEPDCLGAGVLCTFLQSFYKAYAFCNANWYSVLLLDMQQYFELVEMPHQTKTEREETVAIVYTC